MEAGSGLILASLPNLKYFLNNLTNSLPLPKFYISSYYITKTEKWLNKKSKNN